MEPRTYREDISPPDYSGMISFQTFAAKTEDGRSNPSKDADGTAPPPAQPVAAHTASQPNQQLQEGDNANPNLEAQQSSSQSNEKKRSSACLVITILYSAIPVFVAGTIGVILYEPPVSEHYGATLLWIYLWSWLGLMFLLMINAKCSSLHFRILCIPLIAVLVTAMCSLGVYNPNESDAA